MAATSEAASQKLDMLLSSRFNLVRDNFGRIDNIIYICVIELPKSISTQGRLDMATLFATLLDVFTEIHRTTIMLNAKILVC